jgi:2-alkyl-3-oxoalkanoate reductase
MRVFVAGATGVIGTTRSTARAAALQAAGATPVIVEGLVLRYGFVYGRGASGNMLGVVRKRQMPVVDGGTGIWSFCQVTAAAAATAATITRGAPGVCNIVDDNPAWLGRLLAGQLVVSLMTEVRGSANDKAKRELGWAPRYASWRDGFRDWATTAGQAHAA